MALSAFEEAALPELRRLSKSARKDRDRIAAGNVLARAALSESISKSEVKHALGSTIEDIRRLLPTEKAEMLLQVIRPHWTAL